MSIKNFFNNWIVKNLLLAVVGVAAFVGIVSLALTIGTQHGKEITVPDFYEMDLRDAARVAEAAGVRLVVSDSVYVKRMAPGAVYMQTPKAGAQVKKGRKIRLTTNTLVPKKVNMPSLVGTSLRQARAELQRNGLILGRFSYVPDIATNTVLRQLRYGRDIEAGTPINSGTTISLVLGLGEDNSTFVPNLTGRQYQNAINVAQDNSINVGRCLFDDTVKNYTDSVNARVWSQVPEPDSIAVRKGSEVSLYLTLDESKINEAKAAAARKNSSTTSSK